jgi:hypothetical protein
MLEGRGRRHRAGDHIHLLEGALEVLFDQRAHLLRLEIVGVVVAGAERVGAQHDAPLDLRAKAFAARARKFSNMVWRAGAVAKAHAVVARQVGAGLGRGDQVVDRQRLVGVGQADLDDLRAQPGQVAMAARTAASTSGCMPSMKYSLGTPTRSRDMSPVSAAA